MIGKIFIGLFSCADPTKENHSSQDRNNLESKPNMSDVRYIQQLFERFLEKYDEDKGNCGYDWLEGIFYL